MKKRCAGEKIVADWAVAKSVAGEQEEMETAVQGRNWGKLPTSLKLVVQMS